MSRKKHAWTSLFHIIENKSNYTSDELYKEQQSVENAIVQDFMDNVNEDLHDLLYVLDEAPNNDVKLGILLAQESIRKSYYNE
jgi:uncharacterized protein HemY